VLVAASALAMHPQQQLLCISIQTNSSLEAVRSFDEALRLLNRWSSSKQHLNRSVVAAIAPLQQSTAAAALHKALAALETELEAAASGGAASWLQAGLVPALVDHAATCSPHPHNQQQHSPTRRHAGDQRPAHRHAAAIVGLIARASGKQSMQQARLAIRCVCSRLDAGCVQSAVPLLQLLLGLLEHAAQWHAGAVESPQQQAGGTLTEAVVQSGLPLEVLQDLYARTAWHLPAAEILAKLRGGWVGRCVGNGMETGGRSHALFMRSGQQGALDRRSPSQ